MFQIPKLLKLVYFWLSYSTEKRVAFLDQCINLHWDEKKHCNEVSYLHVSDVLTPGWLEFNIPFQHKYGYIRDERSGMESYPLTQWRKASNILTSTLAAFLFSSHQNMDRDREAPLNHYASTYNRGRQLSHCKLNQIKYNKTPTLTLNKKYR